MRERIYGEKYYLRFVGNFIICSVVKEFLKID